MRVLFYTFIVSIAIATFFIDSEAKAIRVVFCDKKAALTEKILECVNDKVNGSLNACRDEASQSTDSWLELEEALCKKKLNQNTKDKVRKCVENVDKAIKTACTKSIHEDSQLLTDSNE